MDSVKMCELLEIKKCELVQLENLLEAYGENLDTMKNAFENHEPFFCDMAIYNDYSMAEIARALLDYSTFFDSFDKVLAYYTEQMKDERLCEDYDIRYIPTFGEWAESDKLIAKTKDVAIMRVYC